MNNNNMRIVTINNMLNNRKFCHFFLCQKKKQFYKSLEEKFEKYDCL